MAPPPRLVRALQSPHLQEVDAALDAVSGEIGLELLRELLPGARWDDGGVTLHPGRVLHVAPHGRYAAIQLLRRAPEDPSLAPLFAEARALRLDHRGDGRRRRALEATWLLRFPHVKRLHLAGYAIASFATFCALPLERLILQSCSLPDDLSGLEVGTDTLQELVITEGSTPTRDPSRLAHASALRALRLTLSKDAALLGLAELPLEHLHVEGGGFSDLQGLPRSLVHLHITRCTSLRGLEGVASCADALEHLTLERCRKLRALDGVQACRGLTTLEATGLSRLTDVRAARGLRNLHRLDLSACKRLADLDGVPSTLTLTELLLSPLPSLERLDGLPKLLGVLELDLSGAPLRSLDGIERLSSLERLSLRATTVSELTPLAELHALRELDLRGCRALTDVSPLAQLPRLQRVTLKGSRVEPRDVPAGLRARCTWAST